MAEISQPMTVNGACGPEALAVPEISTTRVRIDDAELDAPDPVGRDELLEPPVETRSDPSAAMVGADQQQPEPPGIRPRVAAHRFDDGKQLTIPVDEAVDELVRRADPRRKIVELVAGRRGAERTPLMEERMILAVVEQRLQQLVIVDRQLDHAVGERAPSTSRREVAMRLGRRGSAYSVGSIGLHGIDAVGSA